MLQKQWTLERKKGKASAQAVVTFGTYPGDVAEVSPEAVSIASFIDVINLIIQHCGTLLVDATEIPAKEHFHFYSQEVANRVAMLRPPPKGNELGIGKYEITRLDSQLLTAHLVRGVTGCTHTRCKLWYGSTM
eukprot:768532-Pelagomonas_calceolata.AAC.4